MLDVLCGVSACKPLDAELSERVSGSGADGVAMALFRLYIFMSCICVGLLRKFYVCCPQAGRAGAAGPNRGIDEV